MSDLNGTMEPPQQPKKPSSVEAIWGQPVAAHGYTAIPSILIRAQARLGLTPMRFSIVVQLLEYWRDPLRRPFPSKRELADRAGVTEKAIQLNIKAMEEQGLIRREMRRTALGDWDSNIYHLDGLVERVRAMEPDFAKERAARATLREVRRASQALPARRQRRAR